MKKLFYKIGKHLFKKYCLHERKKLVYPDYQEGAYKYKCKDCGKDVWIGMYD